MYGTVPGGSVKEPPSVSPAWSLFCMGAQLRKEAGVYRFPFPVDGRPAVYVVNWDGSESDPWPIFEDEIEQEVVDDLADALWRARPSRSSGRGGAGAASGRPVLRLL